MNEQVWTISFIGIKSDLNELNGGKIRMIFKAKKSFYFESNSCDQLTCWYRFTDSFGQISTNSPNFWRRPTATALAIFHQTLLPEENHWK